MYNNDEMDENHDIDNYEDQHYDYENETNSVDMDRVNMEESIKFNNFNNENNKNIIIQNTYGINQGIQKKNGSQKSFVNKSNKNSNRPGTANIKSQNSNRTNNSNKNFPTNKNTNMRNQNSNINNNQYKKNIIQNKIISNNYNNRINSAKQKLNQNNKKCGSKSEISMSSIHSISHNDNSKIRSNKKNYDNNSKNTSNLRNNQSSNMNNLNEIYQEDDFNDPQNENYQVGQIYYDENGQIIQNYDDQQNYINNEEIIDENQVAEYADDENLKEDILKEFRRIYGNKIDKMLIRSQLQQSTNILELILQNVKLARNKMIKLAKSNQDPDDLAVKIFSLK